MSARFSANWAALLGAAALMASSTGSGLAADVIKFGISTPLSGPAAPWGIPHKNAIELIFDETNAKGGLDVNGKKYALKIVAYDHKYVIAEGVATVNRLIAKDDVKFISILGVASAKANEEAVNAAGALDPAPASAYALGRPRNALTFPSFPASPATPTFYRGVQTQSPHDLSTSA